MEWGDSDAREIANGEKVQLRSFSTGSHKVDTLVSYRYVLCDQNFSLEREDEIPGCSIFGGKKQPRVIMKTKK